MSDPLLDEALRRIAAVRLARQTAMESGDGWEAIVDGQMLALRAAGRIVYVTRNSRPFRQAGPCVSGVTPVRFKGEALPDWLAIAPGRLFLGEDKSTKAARFPVAMVEPHQARTLDAWAAGGGVSVLLVRTSAGRWVLDWPRVPRSGSLTAEGMDGCGARFADNWLTAWEGMC